MILSDCNAFPRNGRILGIDWGARRTGIAITDPTHEYIFIRPGIVVKNSDGSDLIQQIIKIIQTEEPVGIIIGLPVYNDGTESDTSKQVRLFAEKLAGNTNLPILFVPENLTSNAAQESMGRVRVHELKERLDSESARVILENAIAIIKRNN